MQHQVQVSAVLFGVLALAGWLLWEQLAEPPPVAARSGPHEVPGASPPVGPEATGTIGGVRSAAPGESNRDALADAARGLRVSVVDAATAAPIVAAEVLLRWTGRSGNHQSAPVATDAAGTARLVVECDDAIVVHAAASGFVPRQMTLDVVRTVLDLELALQPETPSLVRVVDASTGLPVTGAHVYVTRPHHQAVTSSAKGRPAAMKAHDTFDCGSPAGIADAEGLARLLSTGSGFHVLVASAPGYLSARADAVELPPEPSPLVFSLTKGHSIPIEVVDEAGNPVADREVLVVDFTSDSCFRMRTDTNGKTASPGYAAGSKVRVDVPRTDLGGVAQFLELLRRTTQQDVVVPVTEPVRIVMPATRSVPIDCTWQGGVKGDELQLTLFTQPQGRDNQIDQATVPAEAGRWQGGGMEGGLHVVEARGTHSGIWRADPLMVVPGQRAHVVLVEAVPRDGSLSVTILTPAGAAAVGVLGELTAVASDLGCRVHRAPPGAQQVAVGDDGVDERCEVCGRARSDAVGTMSFPALLPGHYVLTLEHAAHGAATLSVQVGGATAVVATLAAFGTLRGRVVGPPTGGRLMVGIEHTRMQWTRTVVVDPDGTFEVPLAPGNYRASVRFAVPWVDGAPIAIQRSTPQLVAVTAGCVVLCEFALPASFRRVEITVVGAEPSGYEVQAERIFPYDSVGASRWVTKRPLARDGTAVFEQLEGDAAFGLLLMRRSDGHPVAIHSLGRGLDERVTLRVQPAASVHVLVPVGLQVELQPLHAEGNPLREAGWSAEAGPGAEVSFAGVPVGRYRVRVTGRAATGPVRRSADFDVGPQGLRLDWR